MSDSMCFIRVENNYWSYNLLIEVDTSLDNFSLARLYGWVNHGAFGGKDTNAMMIVVAPWMTE